MSRFVAATSRSEGGVTRAKVRFTPLMTAVLSIIVALNSACGSSSTSPSPTPATTAPAATAIVIPSTRPQSPGAVLLAPRPVSFPADDAAHEASLEWWYYNGNLKGSGSESYSFHLVIFKRQSALGRSGFVAHVALTDQQRGTYQFREEISLPPEQKSLAGGFDLTVGGIKAQGGIGQDSVAGSTNDYRLELTLAALKPPVLHGVSGYVGVGDKEASYYYSRTRMQAQGLVVDHGILVPVSGLVWMDHQWGDFTLQGGGGWDWASLQLDDKTDVMVSVVRNGERKIVLSYGTFIDKVGQATHLTQSQIRLEATGSWSSPTTGIRYPSGWTLAVPERDLLLRLEPVLVQQEMESVASVGRVYWEGAVRVSGSAQGMPVSGVGYVELTGYDASGG